MDTFTLLSPASGALGRNDFNPRLETALVPTMSTAMRRLPMLSMPSSRLGMKNLSQNENGLNSALASLVQMPPGTSVQISVSSEGNRYDKLKYAAEEMIREQISTKTERDLSTSKTAALESTVTAQSAKIQKLRTDKSQLQSLLEMEKSAISKLEFENRSLQTLLEGLKAQVTSFEGHVRTSKRDTENLQEQLAQHNLSVQGLEERIQTSIEACRAKQAECDTLENKISAIESEAAAVQTTLEAANVQLQLDLQSSHANVAELEREQATLFQKLESLEARLVEKCSECQELGLQVTELEEAQEGYKHTVDQLQSDLASAKEDLAQEQALFEETKTEHQNRLSELEREHVNLDSEVKMRNTDVEMLEQANGLLKERLKGVMDAKVELEEELQKAQASAVEARDASSEQLDSMSNEWQAFREQAQITVADLTTALETEKVSHLESNKNGQLQREKLTHAAETLKEEQKKQVTVHRAELAELKRTMLGLVAERDEIVQKLKSELSQLTTDTSASASDAKRKIKEASTALDGAMEREKHVNDELAKTTKKLKTEVSRREAADEALRATKTELSALKKETKALRADHEAMKAEREKIGDLAKNDKTALEQHLEAHHATKMELSALKKELKALKTENEVTKEEREKLGDLAKSEKSALEQHVQAHQSTKTELAALKKEIKALKADHEATKVEKEKMSEKSKSEKSALEDRFEAQLSAKSAEMEALNSESEKVAREKEEISRKLAEEISRVEILKKQVLELQSRPVPVPSLLTTTKTMEDSEPEFKPTRTSKNDKTKPSNEKIETPIMPLGPSYALAAPAKLTIRTNALIMEESDGEEEYAAPQQRAKLISKHSAVLASSSKVDTPMPKKKSIVTAHEESDSDEDYDSPSQRPKAISKAPQLTAKADTPVPKKGLQKPLGSGLHAATPAPTNPTSSQKGTSALNWGAKSKTPPNKPETAPIIEKPKNSTKANVQVSAPTTPANAKRSPTSASTLPSATASSAAKSSAATSSIASHTVPAAKKSPTTATTTTNKKTSPEPEKPKTVGRPKATAPKTLPTLSAVSKGKASKPSTSDSLFDQDDDPFFFK